MVDSPLVLKMKDFGESVHNGTNVRYIATEYIDGIELVDYIKSSGPLREDRAK